MSLSSKSGNLSVTFIPNQKASCVCVVVGWKVPDCNWFVLRKLKRGEPCGCVEVAHGTEITTLSYAVAQLIDMKLMGDAKAQQVAKTSGVSCDIQNGEFFVCVKTAGTGTAIRKVLSVIEQCLIPERLYPLYQNSLKLINAKPSREEANHCAAELRDSMKNLTCLIVGKAKLDKAKLDLITESAASKYSEMKDVGTKVKPASLSKPAGKTDFPSLKAKGMAAVLVADFMNVLREKVSINSDEVIIYREKWDKKIDKKKIDSWVNARYGKLVGLGPALVFLASSNCEINPTEAIAFSKKDVTSKLVAEMIKSAF